jgi:pimeloyl-ACP methyl ester carboxylesterase
VLVGHSYGGMSMRLFADLYLNETAGMVLVDPTARDLAPSRDSLPLIAAVKMAQDDGVTEGLAQTCISAAEAGFVKNSTVFKVCVSEGSNPRYSEDINAVYLHLEQTPSFWRAWQSEKIAIDTSSAEQLRTSRRDFGSLPLVVLTQSDDIGPDPKTSRWVKAHDEIASLSRVGVNRIVPDSSHMIMLDQPQAVIDAIDDVLDQVAHGTAHR